jgi:hypothetical protein
MEKKCSRKYQVSQIEQIVIYYCDNELRQNRFFQNSIFYMYLLLYINFIDLFFYFQ